MHHIDSHIIYLVLSYRKGTSSHTGGSLLSMLSSRSEKLLLPADKLVFL